MAKATMASVTAERNELRRRVDGTRQLMLDMQDLGVKGLGMYLLCLEEPAPAPAPVKPLKVSFGKAEGVSGPNVPISQDDKTSAIWAGGEQVGELLTHMVEASPTSQEMRVGSYSVVFWDPGLGKDVEFPTSNTPRWACSPRQALQLARDYARAKLAGV